MYIHFTHTLIHDAIAMHPARREQPRANMKDQRWTFNKDTQKWHMWNEIMENKIFSIFVCGRNMDKSCWRRIVSRRIHKVDVFVWCSLNHISIFLCCCVPHSSFSLIIIIWIKQCNTHSIKGTNGCVHQNTNKCFPFCLFPLIHTLPRPFPKSTGLNEWCVQIHGCCYIGSVTEMARCAQKSFMCTTPKIYTRKGQEGTTR